MLGVSGLYVLHGLWWLPNPSGWCCALSSSKIQADLFSGFASVDAQDGYSFEECCLEDPKPGCWDANFVPERCCVDKIDDPMDHSVNVLETGFSIARFVY